MDQEHITRRRIERVLAAENPLCLLGRRYSSLPRGEFPISHLLQIAHVKRSTSEVSQLRGNFQLDYFSRRQRYIGHRDERLYWTLSDKLCDRFAFRIRRH